VPQVNNTTNSKIAKTHKAIVDIRLRPRCAIPPALRGQLAASSAPRNFHNTTCVCLAHWTIPSAAWRYWQVNDPFCSESLSDAAATAAEKIVNDFKGPDNPWKLPLRLWESAPSSNTWFLRPTWVFIRNSSISIGSAVFAQRTVECSITLQWAATFSPKIAPLP